GSGDTAPVPPPCGHAMGTPPWLQPLTRRMAQRLRRRHAPILEVDAQEAWRPGAAPRSGTLRARTRARAQVVRSKGCTGAATARKPRSWPDRTGPVPRPRLWASSHLAARRHVRDVTVPAMYPESAHGAARPGRPAAIGGPALSALPRDADSARRSRPW